MEIYRLEVIIIYDFYFSISRTFCTPSSFCVCVCVIAKCYALLRHPGGACIYGAGMVWG